MIVNLNGWRRIGVILVVIWITLVITLTIGSYTHNSVNNLIYKAPTVGTIVDGNKIKYPDGTIFNLDIPENTKPWEIDWKSIVNNYQEMPMVYKFNYQNIFIYLLGIPTLGWLLIELIVQSFLWVRKGFKK